MKKIVILSFLIIACILSFGQNNKDSILFNERTIDRPLTLHKGQVQINAGYHISIISANFNEKGNKTDLAELGNAFVEHQYDVNLAYGVFNFLELSTAINYNKKGLRKTNEIYISAFDPSIDISYLDNYKGFSDLYFGAGFSYPFFKKAFELSVEPGISLPVFSNEPDEPDHEIIPGTVGGDYTKIYYINNYKYATGAKVFHFGASGKFRISNFALTFLYASSYPMNISETIKWNHRLSGTEFDYTDETYEYLISDKTYFMIKTEYQALPWFNINIDFSGLSFKNGWSEETSIRLANPETKLYKLTAGCEIKVTEKLWLTQFVGFPIAGENQIAPISFITNFSYNMFPFK